METPQLFLLAAECWVPFLLLGWWMVQGYACVSLIDKESSKLTAFFLLRTQMIFFYLLPSSDTQAISSIWLQIFENRE